MAKDVVERVDQQADSDTAVHQVVYNGEYVSQASYPSRDNRPVKRRKRSPVSLIFVVMAVSLFFVVYIWNKISVIRLAEEVNNLQVQYQKVSSANEVLRAEISQKSRLDRIGAIATAQLGLIYPKEQPIWLDVDPDRFREAEKE